MKTLSRSSRVILAGLAMTVLPLAGAQAQSSPAAGAPPVPRVVGTTGSAREAAMPEYRLGAGDKLRIEVYKDPQLSQSLQIRPDGKITMPLIGDIACVGLTPIELRDRISNSLKEYVTNPVVTVIVVEALASNVYVMGEVTKPGPLAMTGPMTVLQALAMAGGFKDFAKTSDIRILRRTPTGVDTIHFNYRDAVKGSSTPAYLRAGDTVIVP